MVSELQVIKAFMLSDTPRRGFQYLNFFNQFIFYVIIVVLSSLRFFEAACNAKSLATQQPAIKHFSLTTKSLFLHPRTYLSPGLAGIGIGYQHNGFTRSVVGQFKNFFANPVGRQCCWLQ